MGWACRKYGGRDVYRVLVGNLREKDHFGDTDVEGRRALVSAVMNRRVP